jgi:hypothetical protein
MSPLCQYRDVLGKPSEGVHAARWMGMARNDVTMTAVAAVLTSSSICIRPGKALVHFAVWMLAALLLHRIFCVNTTLTKLCFGKQ